MKHARHTPTYLLKHPHLSIPSYATDVNPYSEVLG